MINNLPLTALIPARGGSKGIPGKNLRKLGNDTLLERTIKQALACDYIDTVIVSTDDDEMYEISEQYKVSTPAPRPPSLATDEAGTIDVILHTLNEMNINQGYLILLQTTTPLRTVADISQLCEMFERDTQNAQAIVTVCDTASHPDKMQKIDKGFLRSYLGRNSHVSRQLLPDVYELNGACYLTDINTIVEQKTLIPKKTLPFIMPVERSVNLDSMLDWYLLEKLVDDNIVKLEEYDS